MNLQKFFKGLPLAVAGLSFLAAPTNAATTFITNTSGNASALQGAGAGATTALTLSATDGGGTLNVNTIGVFVGGATTLGMDGDSMGVSNDKWGDPTQTWSFSLDQTVDFGGFEFFGGSLTYTFESVAWKDDANASGTNWSFTGNGTIGKFTFSYSGGSTNVVNAESYDFSTAGVSSVPAGTQMSIYKSGGASGGQMASFTLTPIPEPSALVLAGAGVIGLALRRRR